MNDILQQIDDLSAEGEGATKWTGADDVERETTGDEAQPRHVKGVLIDPGFDASDYKYLISLNSRIVYDFNRIASFVAHVLE